MLVESLTFSSGATIPTSPLTIVLGPNNVGKSRALREILAHTQNQGPVFKVISKIGYNPPDSWAELRKLTRINVTHHGGPNYSLSTLGPELTSAVQLTQFGSDPADGSNLVFDHGDPAARIALFKVHFSPAVVAYMGTEQRLLLANRGPSASPISSPTTLLQEFFQNRDLASKVNDVVEREFNTIVRLDSSGMTELVLRVGDIGSELATLPPDPRDAAPVASLYEMLDTQGDGIRSFVAMLLVSVVAKRPLTLIDEPETFLHPPQAAAIGKFLAQVASDQQQVILSTHSTDVVRGALSAGCDVSIIRLLRAGRVNWPQPIPSTRIDTINSDPLLSASSILEALFFPGAIVCEADSDRAFYERVADRTMPGHGIYYTNVQGKHTIERAIRAYRDIGMWPAAIVDIDALRERAPFQKLLHAGTDDDTKRTQVLALRDRFVTTIQKAEPADLQLNIARKAASLQDVLSSTEESEIKVTKSIKIAAEIAHLRDDWGDLKAGGVERMSSSQRAAFDPLNAALRGIGIFLVPVGELEYWLGPYGHPAINDTRSWINRALPLAKNLAPQDRGPWQFVRDIHGYLNDATRQEPA
jgi:hypothetical protein